MVTKERGRINTDGYGVSADTVIDISLTLQIKPNARSASIISHFIILFRIFFASIFYP